jgi:hypothetical protein
MSKCGSKNLVFKRHLWSQICPGCDCIIGKDTLKCSRNTNPFYSDSPLRCVLLSKALELCHSKRLLTFLYIPTMAHPTSFPPSPEVKKEHPCNAKAHNFSRFKCHQQYIPAHSNDSFVSTNVTKTYTKGG